MIAGISNRWFDEDRVLVVVIASVTEGVDWAAYQDAMAVVSSRRPHQDIRAYLVDRASKHGDKVSEAEARALFPGIDLPYRS
jgi:hypothetical protein